MQAAQNPADRHGLVVLHKDHIQSGLPEIVLIIRLYKISPLIPEYRRLNHI